MAASFRIAVVENRFIAPARWLKEGADVNGVDDWGMTPLMLASLRGHPKMVRRLIAKGADARRTSATDFTALHFGGRNSNHHAVPALVLAGADITPARRTKKPH